MGIFVLEYRFFDHLWARGTSLPGIKIMALETIFSLQWARYLRMVGASISAKVDGG